MRAQVIRNEDLCKVCDEYSTPEGVVGHCGFCKRDDQRLLGSETRVCVECIHDPKKRSSIRTSLKHKINEVKKGECEIPVLELPEPNLTRTEERRNWDEAAARVENGEVHPEIEALKI